MKVAVEEISPVKKAIKIEVPLEIVTREISEAYSTLKKRVQIPGFRKGKAPQSILEKRYAQSVEEDVIRKLVPDYYQRAIKETGLRPVELPAIEKVELKKDAPLSFTANVEITPEIKLGTYEGLKLKAPRVEVTNMDVDRALEALQDQQSHLEACPDDHIIADKDFVVMDFEGMIDGTPFEGGTGKNQTVQVGSNAFIPGFEDQLLKHKKGDEFMINTPFPDNYPKKDLAGKKAGFAVQIREVKKKVLPKLDDEFAKDLGSFESLEKLKEKIRADLEERFKKESEQAIRRESMKQVVEAHHFEVPGSLIEREVQDSIHRLQQRLPKGVTLEQANMDPAKLRQEIEPVARDKVKGRLILQAIAGKEKITVEKEDIDKAVEETAVELKLAPDDVRRLILSQDGSMDVFRARLMEDKALDWVVSQAKIEK